MSWQKSPVQYCATSGKVMYDKRGAVTSANHRFEEDHTRLRVYPCPSCNAWHLTSQFRSYGPKRRK